MPDDVFVGSGGGCVGEGIGVAVGATGVAVCGIGVTVGSGVFVFVGGIGVRVSVGGMVAVTMTTAVTTTVSLNGVAVAGIAVFVGRGVDVCNAVGDRKAMTVAVGDAPPIPKLAPNRINNATHNKTPIAAAAAIAR